MAARICPRVEQVAVVADEYRDENVLAGMANLPLNKLRAMVPEVWKWSSATSMRSGPPSP